MNGWFFWWNLPSLKAPHAVSQMLELKVKIGTTFQTMKETVAFYCRWGRIHCDSIQTVNSVFFSSLKTASSEISSPCRSDENHVAPSLEPETHSSEQGREQSVTFAPALWSVLKLRLKRRGKPRGVWWHDRVFRCYEKGRIFQLFCEVLLTLREPNNSFLFISMSFIFYWIALFIYF